VPPAVILIALEPNSPTAYLNLGLLEAESNTTLPAALRNLEQAVKLQPSLRTMIPAERLEVGRPMRVPVSTPSHDTRDLDVAYPSLRKLVVLQAGMARP
jgi:hypothetical protein